MNFFPYTKFGRLAGASAALVLTAALAGCGKEEPKVYSVAKETAPSPAAASMPHGAGGPGNTADPHGAIAGATPRVTYQVPPGWKEQPAVKMRAASFMVEGAEGKFTEISVVPLPAVGGKEADMVNIWRGQLRLTPATEADLAKAGETVDIGEAKGRLFDQASTELLVESKHKARIVVAMLTREGLTWFFKMAGEDSLTAAQTPAFKTFLKSVAFVVPQALQSLDARGQLVAPIQAWVDGAQLQQTGPASFAGSVVPGNHVFKLASGGIKLESTFNLQPGRSWTIEAGVGLSIK